MSGFTTNITEAFCDKNRHLLVIVVKLGTISVLLIVDRWPVSMKFNIINILISSRYILISLYILYILMRWSCTAWIKYLTATRDTLTQKDS